MIGLGASTYYALYLDLFKHYAKIIAYYHTFLHVEIAEFLEQQHELSNAEKFPYGNRFFWG